MLNYVDDDETTKPSARKRSAAEASMEGHYPTMPKTGKPQCIVCRLESRSGINPSLGERGTKNRVSVCSKCKTAAHAFVPTDSGRQIHGFEQFQHMTCFDIVHSTDGCELWPLRSNLHHPKGPRGLKQRHPIYRKLRVLHGKPEKRQQLANKQKNTDTTELDDSSSSSSSSSSND
jgi:hypothetical protein